MAGDASPADRCETGCAPGPSRGILFSTVVCLHRIGESEFDPLEALVIVKLRSTVRATLRVALFAAVVFGIAVMSHERARLREELDQSREALRRHSFLAQLKADIATFTESARPSVRPADARSVGTSGIGNANPMPNGRAAFVRSTRKHRREVRP